MSTRPRILILTSKTGGGHVSLATALRDRLATSYDIRILDPQHTFFHLHYRTVSRYALWLWSTEFRMINSPERALQAHRFFTRLVGPRLQLALDHVRPDLIVTTYPFLSYEVARLLEKQPSRIPFVMLFTDPLDLHASWLTERGADLTLAPTRETEAQALAAGFTRARLHLSGWPVRGQFYRADPANHDTFLRSLGLDPARFTIFLQGGGEGAAQFGRTVQTVLASGPQVQIILACGTNQALRQRYGAIANVHALPFTREIAPFMAAADVVMGKAGPNMLFESVTLGKPFIATAYIPGQEEANLDFIQRHNLGWVALDVEKQRELVNALATGAGGLQQAQVSVNAYRAWNIAALDTIPPLIGSLLAESGPHPPPSPTGRES